LRPDDSDYQFERYFRVNLLTGEIQPQIKDITEEERNRAKTTIRLYRLNSYDRPGARMDAWERYKDMYNSKRREAENKQIPFILAEYPLLNTENYSYRFFIQYLLNIEEYSRRRVEQSC
jgi:hypothetical protein